MGRKARNDLFTPDEVAVIHVMNRVHHGNHLMGFDKDTGIDYSYRRTWFRNKLRHVAGGFALDLLAYAIMSNHFHLILRSRPDIVKLWSDREVARRWLYLCPNRKDKNGRGKAPTEREINSLKGDKKKIKQLRSRLSDISWLVRLVCQHMAQKVNGERPDKDVPGGKFFDNRFKAVRLLDEAALVSCSVYIDSNPIRALLCEVLEKSDFTSVQDRLNSMLASTDATDGNFSLVKFYADHGLPCISDENPNPSDIDISGTEEVQELLRTVFDRPDSHLSPLCIDEKNDPVGPRLTRSPYRCSDKGSLPMSFKSYLQLLEWSVRQAAPDKRGSTPAETPELLVRLNISTEAWCELVTKFDKLFSLVAGLPATVDKERGSTRQQRYHMKSRTRELLSPTSATTIAAATTQATDESPSSTNDQTGAGSEGKA